jgi:hypothetical protein
MWADVAARGWSLTVLTTFATGQPVLLTAPNQTSSTLINPLPNRVCNGRSDPLSSHIRNNGFLWFDPACFIVPPVGFFGHSGPTVLNGLGSDNWDVGVEKILPLLHEACRVQFRAECLIRGITRNSNNRTGMRARA